MMTLPRPPSLNAPPSNAADDFLRRRRRRAAAATVSPLWRSLTMPLALPPPADEDAEVDYMVVEGSEPIDVVVGPPPDAVAAATGGGGVMDQPILEGLGRLAREAQTKGLAGLASISASGLSGDAAAWLRPAAAWLRPAAAWLRPAAVLVVAVLAWRFLSSLASTAATAVLLAAAAAVLLRG